MTSLRNNRHLQLRLAFLLWLLGANLLAWTFTSAALTAEKGTSPTVGPREATEQLCSADFDGNKERYEVAWLTPEYKAAKRKEGYDFDGKVYLWDWNPYVIVTSYEIETIKVDGKRGTATVAYRRVGRSEGKEKIVAETPRREVVTLNLTFDGTRWWVIDPPPARVSKKELLIFHEKEIASFPTDWLQRPDISEQQKSHFRQRQEALRILKALPDE